MPGEPHHPQRVLYYNCVHLRVVEKPALVLDISAYWERKLSAIACYQSQFVTGRATEPPTFLDRLRDQAAFWGWSIGAGIEHALTDQLRIRGDYLYTRFKGHKYYSTSCAVTCDIDVHDFGDHEFRVGLAWAF